MLSAVTLRGYMLAVALAFCGCGPSVQVEEAQTTLTPRMPVLSGAVWGSWSTQHLDGGQAKTRPYPMLHLVFEETLYDPNQELRQMPSIQRRSLLDERLRRDRLLVTVAPESMDGLPLDSPFGKSVDSALCAAAALACVHQVCTEMVREPCGLDVALVADLSMPMSEPLDSESAAASEPAPDRRGAMNQWEMELSAGAAPGEDWLSGRLALKYADDDDNLHGGVLALEFSVPLIPERLARCNLMQFQSGTPVHGWPCDGEGEAAP